jgi:hypothetical protein
MHPVLLFPAHVSGTVAWRRFADLHAGALGACAVVGTPRHMDRTAMTRMTTRH